MNTTNSNSYSHFLYVHKRVIEIEIEMKRGRETISKQKEWMSKTN